MVEPAARFEEVEIPIPEEVAGVAKLSGVLGVPEWWPTGSRVGLVLAHDKGSNADDPTLVELQRGLTERGYLSLRFNFPFAEAGKRRPDKGPILERAFLEAVQFLGRDPTAAPAHLILGGKGIGGSVAARTAMSRLRVEGLFFLGFPLHPADKPENPDTELLYRVISPMLFLQGTRDRYCDLDTLRQTLVRVGAPKALHVVEEADHAFKVLKKSGRTAEEVNQELLGALDRWISGVLGT